MHYRASMVLGRVHVAGRTSAKVDALRLLTEHLMPGRWADVRATERQGARRDRWCSRLPLDEWSVKVSDGPPDDDAERPRPRPVWAGVVPLRRVLGRTDATLPTCGHGIAVPAYVGAWRR